MQLKLYEVIQVVQKSGNSQIGIKQFDRMVWLIPYEYLQPASSSSFVERFEITADYTACNCHLNEFQFDPMFHS